MTYFNGIPYQRRQQILAKQKHWLEQLEQGIDWGVISFAQYGAFNACKQRALNGHILDYGERRTVQSVQTTARRIRENPCMEKGERQ